MDAEKTYRKVAVNTLVAFAGIVAASASQFVPDPSLAFLVSTIGIHVACLAAVFACAWPFYLAYLDGDLEGDYDPVSGGELLSLGWNRVRRTLTPG